MTNQTRYGVISDIHDDPRVINPALEVLQREGIDELLVNGDIGGNYGSLEQSQGYTAMILDAIGRSGLQAYVQPGSHETIGGFHPVLDHFAQKYPTIHSVFDARRVQQEGHDLVFIPGSDFLCGGEYQIGNGEMQTGIYKSRKGLLHYENMQDIRTHVRNPENTIVVCHVPRKFDTLENGVDVAEFGEATFDFPLRGEIIKKGSVFPRPAAEIIANEGYPIALKKENRGNEDLAKIYDELGITKAISGHFHESSHRAHDSQGNNVPEGTLVEELFWNSGHLDQGYTGVLTVQGNKVSYKNISVGN